MTTWKIAYTIHDGEHEYGESFTCELAADRLDETQVAELIADQWGCGSLDDREDFLRELREEGHAFLPCDSRAIGDLGWEKVSPIIITVRNGFVEAVNGVPQGITVEVRDWDNGEEDENGKPVPTVAEWPGPL